MLLTVLIQLQTPSSKSRSFKRAVLEGKIPVEAAAADRLEAGTLQTLGYQKLRPVSDCKQQLQIDFTPCNVVAS